MQLSPFSLERYFAEHEFTAPLLLSPSDCESWRMEELLALADEEALSLWKNLALGYTQSEGHPRLREAVARLYEGIEAADLLGVIPCEGILLAMHALLEPGDHVLATHPTYQSLHEVARSIGCRVEAWGPGESGFEIETALTRLRPETRALVVNFPHNPTGATLSPADFRSLLSAAEERGIVVFSDEMYRFAEYQESDRLPAACEISSLAISLGGLSKPFGLPGLRVGWLATRNRGVLGRMAELKDYTTLCGSAPSEILALIALGARRQILKRNGEILRSNLAQLTTFMGEHADLLSWSPPQAGPVTLVRHNLALSDDEFAERLLSQGLLVAMGTHFQAQAGSFRVGFGRRSFGQALERLRSFLAGFRASKG